MKREYGICKACGNVVYRDDDGPWLLASDEDQRRDNLPIILCGCND